MAGEGGAAFVYCRPYGVGEQWQAAAAAAGAWVGYRSLPRPPAGTVLLAAPPLSARFLGTWGCKNGRGATTLPECEARVGGCLK